MTQYKFIRDAVHGNLKLDPYLIELIETPEMQRLAGIRQLGFSYLVFPGANHTRLEHSLGTCHVARQICRSLGLSQEDTMRVTAVSLLHDVGHGPYSHTLENLFHERFGFDHARLTQDIIRGKHDIIPDGDRQSLPGRKRIHEVLQKYKIDPESVAELVTGACESGAIDLFGRKAIKSTYPAHIIHSALDADQIDYLLRDSHYTGVAYGTVDLDRLLQTMSVFRNQLVIHEKGVSAVESILVARALMYTSVYLHKTVRIAELMLARAVERALLDGRADGPRIWGMTDSELMSFLSSAGTYEREIATRLRYRRLYKRAWAAEITELDEGQKDSISRLDDGMVRRRKERLLCQRASMSDGSAIIDLPAPELLLSEPRISKVDVKILTEEGKLKPFSAFSPLSGALRVRTTVKWAVMVVCPEEYKERAAKAAKKVLFE